MRGLSQRELGNLLGLGKSTGGTRINRYEQRVSQPDIQTVGILCDVLDVPMAYLFAESDEMAQMLLRFRG